jgi:UDP-N-acetylmuramoyl-L-alanyl-D-glutamate--2,6-diaminopimelate ligase
MWPLSGREIAEACGTTTSIGDVWISGVALSAGDVQSGDLYVAVKDGDWDGHAEIEQALEAGACVALVSHGWAGRASDDRLLRVEDTLVAFRRVAAFFRARFSFPVIAVGGSNGKTTTKEMIAALASGGGGARRYVTKTPETMNGWTGIPLTLTLREHARAAPPAALVVEIGIDAIGVMAEHAKLVDPDVAVITSLGPEHLSGLGDLATVVAEETKLFDASPRTKRIIHADDPHLAAWLRQSTRRDGDLVVSSRREGAVHGDVIYEIVTASPTRVEVTIAWQKWRGTFVLPMSGRHNGENFALAFAAALAVGRTPQEIASGLGKLAPPSMRCEVRELGNGVILVDDAYNANPSSMEAAFCLLRSPQWIGRPKMLVLGDMLELGAESERLHVALSDSLRSLLADGARVFLYGDEMRVLHRALGDDRTTILPRDADPRALLDDPAFGVADAVILVKGSRGMHLERVVTALVDDPMTKAVTTEADVLRFAGRFRSACVTGTNGKTTTTSLIAAICEAAGETSCRVTTLGSFIGDEKVEGEASGPAFVRTLARASKRGVKTIAVETTSHALAGGFARTWPADVAVLTNFSRDHLDYHGSPEEYLAAKAQLFMSLDPDHGAVAVLNVADPASALIDEIMPAGVRRMGYAARSPDPACANIPLELFALPDAISVDEDGTHARLAPSALGDALGNRIDLVLVGAMHIENALAAALAGHALGHSAESIRTGLSKFGGVDGRFQVVHVRPFVVVDYAHTPDALVRTLDVARSLVAARYGKVICVFGCGGERDPGKRGEMGAVASTSADVVIVTNDNPRSEDAASIADAIEAGARKGAASLRRILDRREAIACAVELAAPSDIVVIAGKGHEKTQVVGSEELPFDDVVIARHAATREGKSGR